MKADLQGFDRALIRRYERPGPRYTSYPTAVQFRDDLEPRRWVDALTASGRPLSLYLHLPFCESLCWFCACTTVITRDSRRVDAYLGALEAEVALWRTQLGGARVLEEVHLGGGSPSFLTPGQLERLLGLLDDAFPGSPATQRSVELDPRTLTADKVTVLAGHGFRRASFGVQDVDTEVQQAVHRHQPHALNTQAVGWLRAADFTSLNIDLIYGLPRQSVDSLRRTLDTVLTYEPDRLAVFSYAHVPWVAPAQKILERQGLPDAGEKLEMLACVIETLVAAGYRHIGMDHFARPEDELTRALDAGRLYRTFQGYSTHGGGDLLGLGMSSIGHTERTYFQNHKDLKAYSAALEAGQLPLWRGLEVSDEDLRRRAIITRLMCRFGLDYAELSAALGLDFPTTYAAELAALDPMEDDGLLVREPGGLRVTPQGRWLIRNIAMTFDSYVQPAAHARHAMTI